jgi:hypothetical protein
MEPLVGKVDDIAIRRARNARVDSGQLDRERKFLELVRKKDEDGCVYA